MILLSFDIEEFDGPLEHGVDYSLEEGMKVSVEGTNIILDILKANDVRATFFCTGNFAENAPDIIQRIMDEGHEVACHGVDHWQPKESDFALSKEIVENVSGITVTGYRQPRMFPVVESEIKRENPPHMVYEGWSHADSSFSNTTLAIPAILAIPAQST